MIAARQRSAFAVFSRAPVCELWANHSVLDNTKALLGAGQAVHPGPYPCSLCRHCQMPTTSSFCRSWPGCETSAQVSLHSPGPLTTQVHGSAQERAEQGINERDIPRRAPEQLGIVQESQAGFPGARTTEANQSSETHFCPSWRFPQEILVGFSVWEIETEGFASLLRPGVSSTIPSPRPSFPCGPRLSPAHLCRVQLGQPGRGSRGGEKVSVQDATLRAAWRDC